MEIISQVSFEEVIHSWLKDEWSKSAYDVYRTAENEKMVSIPDFSNDFENLRRLKIFLHDRLPMYSSILERAQWNKVKVVKGDIDRIYQCYSSEWNKFSNETFRVSETVKNIFPDSKVDIQRADKIKQIYSNLNSTPKVDGLILIGTNKESNLTIIEGCHRFTAVYEKVKNEEQDKVIADYAFMGTSSEMTNYAFCYKK